jgi:hypothetical protein
MGVGEDQKEAAGLPQLAGINIDMTANAMALTRNFLKLGASRAGKGKGGKGGGLGAFIAGVSWRRGLGFCTGTRSDGQGCCRARGGVWRKEEDGY